MTAAVLVYCKWTLNQDDDDDDDDDDGDIVFIGLCVCASVCISAQRTGQSDSWCVSSKTVKETDFKFDIYVSRNSSDMIP